MENLRCSKGDLIVTGPIAIDNASHEHCVELPSSRGNMGTGMTSFVLGKVILRFMGSGTGFAVPKAKLATADVLSIGLPGFLGGSDDQREMQRTDRPSAGALQVRRGSEALDRPRPLPRPALDPSRTALVFKLQYSNCMSWKP